MSDRETGVADLLRYLSSLVREERRDRGALAALRRGAGEPPGSAPEMFPLVEPCLPEGIDDRQADAAYRVAALFALHHQGSNRPHEWAGRADGRYENRSLGHSLRLAAVNDRGEIDSGMERRFAALLNARSSDLDHHLRQVFSLLRAKNAATPVDYRQLYEDLVQWDHPERFVQRKWAEGFWRGGRGEASEEAGHGGSGPATLATNDNDSDDDN
jgi:CRISPR system Cascade subunit CasB